MVLTSLLQAMEADPSGRRGSRTASSCSTSTGLGNFLPLSQRQRIEQIPGVVAVSPETWFGGVYKDDKPENWIGQLSADPDIYFDKIFDDATIDPAGQRRVEGDAQRVRRGQEDRRQVRLEEGRPHHPEGTYIPINLDLVYIGPYNAGDESNIFFHNEYLNQSNWFGANTADTGSTT